MEKNIEKVAKNEVSKQSNEVYVMIGNGFDIECGLPTAYGDFLNFLKAVERVDKNPEDRLEDIALKPQIRDALLSAPVGYNAWKPSIDNFWYAHFQKAALKQRWVDFEAEIARVIRIVESSMDFKRYSRATMEDYVYSYGKSELYGVLSSILEHTAIESEDNLPDGTT